METKTLPENRPPRQAIDYSSNVDTSRAFRSVKEAVEVFGEKFLTGEIFLPSPKPPFSLPKQETPSWKSTHSSQTSWKSTHSSQTSWKSTHSSQTSWKSCSPPRVVEEEPPSLVVTSLKKLETELEETKKELKLLKERESETEVALASLNAELHKNKSKIAKAEAAEAAEKAAAMRSPPLAPMTDRAGGGSKVTEKKVKKKKPIVPLLGDLFSKKKGKSNASLLNPLYASSQMHWV